MKNVLVGWKTRLVAILVVLLGALELYDPGVWAMLLPAEYRPFVTIGIGVLMYALRQITHTPVGGRRK